MKRQFYIWTAGLVLLISISFIDIFMNCQSHNHDILWLLRIPKTLTALIAGAALALSGIQMQSILRNPLADPHILGITSGASLGAAAATLAGIGALSTTMSAFLGAGLTAVLIMAASRKLREATTLLIFGVMLGFILNAVISVMQYMSNAENLKIFYSWSAGSFSLTRWSEIGIMAIALIIGSVIAAGGHKGLDIILFGEDFTQMTGADTRKIHFRALISCSIMTGAVTAFCGPIGFLGIVAPHIARAIFKTSAHKTILPGSILAGCIISISADILSQLSPTPLPVSSTMALIGIPIIIYVITRKLK